MLISTEKIYINQQEMTLKTYVKKTNYIRYKVRDTEIKLTMPQILYKQGSISEYKNRMIKNLEEKLKNVIKNPTKDFFERDTINIMGNSFQIVNSNNLKSFIDLNSKIIHINQELDKNNKSKILKKIIFQYVYNILQERVLSINKLTIQGKIKEITIKDNKSTWGYCTSQNKLNFSINLLFQPLWVIDYVIIHELAHLIHKNHSQTFWSLVAKHFPQYKQAKLYLKQQGSSNRI